MIKYVVRKSNGDFLINLSYTKNFDHATKFDTVSAALLHVVSNKLSEPSYISKIESKGWCIIEEKA